MKAFKEQGYFWWPEKKDEKFFGFLEYDPIKGGSLKIVHTDIIDDKIKDQKARLKKANDLIKQFGSTHKIILGCRRKDNRGATWTLYNCNGYKGDNTSFFYIEKIFSNNLFSSEDRIKYKMLALYLPMLEFWVKENIIKLPFNEYHNGKEGYGVHVLPKKTILSKVRNNLTIKFCISTNYKKGNVYCNIQKKPYFLLNYTKNTHIDEIERDLNHLKNFISLATSEPVFLEKIWSYNKERLHTKEIFIRRDHTTKDLNGRLMYEIFYFEDLEKIGFKKALKNWYFEYNQLKHIYDMFFLTYYTQNLIGFQFLSLAQALDSYTWIFLEKEKNDYVINTVEFKKRKNELLECISDSKKDKYRKWLNKYLTNNAKNINYEDRISNLVLSFEFIRKIPNFNNFVKAIAQTRHAISHGDSEEKKKRNPFCYEGEDLYWLFYGAKMILTAVFLRKIGFPDDKIIECLKRFYEYRKILEGEYKFEEKIVEVEK